MSSTYRSMSFAANNDLTSIALPTMPKSGPGSDLTLATLAAGSPGSRTEFSQGSGSVRVRRGDRVAQGEQLGELGNSGDSTGPHVHYQLQDGPRWEFADGLPMHFENVSSLTRGSYFDAG